MWKNRLINFGLSICGVVVINTIILTILFLAVGLHPISEYFVGNYYFLGITEWAEVVVGMYFVRWLRKRYGDNTEV